MDKSLVQNIAIVTSLCHLFVTKAFYSRFYMKKVVSHSAITIVELVTGGDVGNRVAHVYNKNVIPFC